MDTVEFHIQIHGEQPDSGREVSPETLSFKDLAELLVPVQDALTKMALDAELDGLAPFKLVGEAKTASADLTARIPASIQSAAATLTSAVASGDWSEVPKDAHSEIYNLSKVLARRNWRMRFLPSGTEGIVAAEISPERPVAEPTAPTQVQELTSIYGELLVVGGVDATKYGRLRLFDGRVIPLDLSEAIAKQLAPRLFEEVCLEGVATWNTVTMRITRFKVARVTEYRATDPREAFAALRDAVDGAFDEIDPIVYQRRVRHGG